MPSPMHRAFGLPGGELRPLVGLALVYAAIGGAIAAGDATVHAVFLSRAGADHLPEVLLARALVSPVLAFAYARLARPRSPRAVLGLLTLVAAGAELGAMAWMERGATGATGAYVVHELAISLVTVHWGVYLLHHLSGERALRGVALVYAAGRGGGAVAGLALVPIVSIHTPWGMVLVALFFGVAALLGASVGLPPTGRPSDPDKAPEPDDVPRPTLPPERRAGWRLLLRSRLLLALLVATALLVLVRFFLRYQQQSLLEGMGEADLATLLAVYAAAANAVGVALQLFVVGRLFPRLGLTRANTLYAAAVAIAQTLLVAVPGLPAALAARFADGELKHTIKTPLSSLFYEAFPAPDRGPARAVVLGVVSPAAQVLAALGLGAMVAGAPGEALMGLGLGVALLYGVATLVQNRSYERAIRRGSLPPRD